jgi:NAD-dependent SIR2 family protein deacetylase
VCALQELFPGQFQPTPAHHFIKLLHEKGLLLRCYSQNIDSLESAAGLPADKLIAAHGNFDSATCMDCDGAADIEHVWRCVHDGQVWHLLSCGSIGLFIRQIVTGISGRHISKFPLYM